MWNSSQPTYRPGFRFPFAIAAAASLALALPAANPAAAQEPSAEQPAITLDRPDRPSTASVDASTSRVADLRAANPRAVKLGYRDFGLVKARDPGTSSSPQAFSFSFHAITQVTRVSSQGDFEIVPGGSCAEGHVYANGDQCTVTMRFTPKGPGHRTGKLILSHTASAQPMIVPTGGDSYASAVSFIPATITTVPATVNNGTGNFQAVYSLTVDGGDNLYIPDYVANTVSYLDSSGSLTVIAGGGSNASQTYNGLGTGVKLSNPWGVATDYVGNLYIADESNQVVRVLAPYGFMDTALGGTANSNDCSFTSPCGPTGVYIGSPTVLATDPYGNLYANLYQGSPYIAEVAFSTGAADSFYYVQALLGDSSNSEAIAADANGNLYTTGDIGAGSSNTALCAIYAENQTFVDGDISGAKIWPVAGNRNCGYSGDEGPATGAEIGAIQQQFAWDAAGNFYFTDTSNNAVRRIDVYTGIIHTVAGLGIIGYSGDGGPATSALLSTPSGLAVDSLGNVYASSYATSNTVVRKIGGAGQLAFLPQLVGVASAAKTILVTDTGSAPLNLSKATLTSGNTADFSIDPVTTDCSFTVALNPGESCKIGVIFKPTAAGSRTAVITLTDDTLSGTNLIQISGIAGTTAAKAVFSPASLAFPAQTLNTTSATANVTLTNTGGLPLDLSYVASVTGPNAASFQAGSECGASLAAGANCIVEIDFTPTAPGVETASVNLASSIGNLTLPLTGTGYTPLKTSVPSINFGTLTIGTNSPFVTVVVTNTGPRAVALTSGTSVFPANDYSYGQTCATSLPAGGSCNLVVGFGPSAPGTFPALLTMDTAAGPVQIKLLGVGILGMAASPATLTFPPTVIDTRSVTEVLTVTNSGSNTLTFTSIEESSDFLDVGGQGGGTCTGTLAPGKSCTFDFFNEPGYVGSGEGYVTLNTSRGPLTFLVIATGIPAPTAAAIQSSANPAKEGKTIAFITQVASKTKALPTGAVELLEGTTMLARTTLISGKATFDLSNLATGTHTLVSHYLGDKQHNPSTSSPIHQVISAKITVDPIRIRP